MFNHCIIILNKLKYRIFSLIHLIFILFIQLEIVELLVNFGADILAETKNGETVFDICEDIEMHTRLIEIKQEVERKKSQQQDLLNKPGKPRELVRRRSSTNPRR